MGPLKGHWGTRTDDDFFFQVASDFVTQLEEIMESEKIDRAELARKLSITKGRVSQILNDPGNLTLKNIVRYARVLDRSVSIVTYERVNAANESGPIPPQVFVTCWRKAGTPTDSFSANAFTATTVETAIGERWAIRIPKPPTRRQFKVTRDFFKHDMEKLEHAGTNTAGV